MSDQPFDGPPRRRRRRRGPGTGFQDRGPEAGFQNRGPAAPQYGNRPPQRDNRPMQRVWKCPSCGRTRPGAGADARAPLCRQDLSEMRIALVPGPFQRRQQNRRFLSY
jgi:hypothetical protein